MSRPKKNIDLAKLERLASFGLSVKEISWSLGINPDTFYENQKNNTEFSETIAKGRSKAIIACAQTVLNVATRKKDPRWALEYLKRHADGWREKREIETNQAGETKLQDKSQLDEKTQERVAITFLQLKGYDINPPKAIDK